MPSSIMEKPLTYESSKVVLQSLEANKRIFLAACCPSLRNLHQIVPFKINTLVLDGTKLSINNYQHIFRSAIVRGRNVENVEYDVDQNGNRDTSNTLDEADFSVLTHDGLEFENATGLTDPSCRELVSAPSVRIQFSLARFGYGHRPFHSFPAKTMIKDALRNHLRNILGGKRMPLIKFLDVNPSNSTVIRFPKEIKLKVQRLRLHHTDQLTKQGMESILTEAPLQELTLINADGTMDSDLSRKAQILNIHVDWMFSQTNVFELRNPEIYVQGYLGMVISFYSRLPLNWLEKGRECGSKFTMRLESNPNRMKEIKTNVEGRWGQLEGICRKCLVRKMDRVNDLVIYEENIGNNNVELIMIVIPRGSVRLMEE